MKKIIYFFSLFICALSSLYAQVGVYTNTPKSTLDVERANFGTGVNGNLVPEGIGLPVISKANLAAKNYGSNGYGSAQNGVVVFVDDISGTFTGNSVGNNAVKNIQYSNTLYMFDGTLWLPTSGEPPSPYVYASKTATDSGTFKYGSAPGANDDQQISLLSRSGENSINSISVSQSNLNLNWLKIDRSGYYDIKAYFGWNSGNESVSGGNAVVIILKLQHSTDNGISWNTISSATYSMINVAANTGTTLRVPNFLTELQEGDLLRFAFQSPAVIPTTSSGNVGSYTPAELEEHRNGTINLPTGLTFTEMIVINKI